MSTQDQLKETIKRDYERRINMYQEDQKTYPIVFAGDSMFGFMHVKKYFNDFLIHNQGIPGDTTIGLQNRIKYIIFKEPETVFINIGSNDLVLLKSSPHEIIDRIIMIINQLKKSLPLVNIYLLTLTPVLSGDKISNEAYIAGRKNEDIKAINHLLKKYVAHEEIIDCYELLLNEEGNLNRLYTTDGIHLNEEGYQILTSKMKEKIESR